MTHATRIKSQMLCLKKTDILRIYTPIPGSGLHRLDLVHILGYSY